MTITKHFRPKWTLWRPEEITKDKIRHKRRERRLWKQYLKCGDRRIRDKAERKLTNWDFD